MPLTAQVLDEEVESREEFAIRRIWWVAECCHREGECLKRWELIRQSGGARLVDRPEVRDAINEALHLLNPLQYGLEHETGEV